MKRFTLMFALALGGCTTVPPASAGPTSGFNQVAVAGGANIRPIQLVEDSRCPSDARCIWAGRLVLLAEVNYAGGSEEFRGNMTLGEPLLLGRETVTLVAVEPSPMAGTKIDPRAYRFTFTYSRAD